MLKTPFVVSMFSVATLVLGAGNVLGQDYPNRPIRIITLSAGGGSDLVARLISQGISAPLGQQMVIENRAGPGSVAGEAASKAPPDGYSVLVAGSSFWGATLLRKTPYDVWRDFSAITLVDKQPQALLIHPALPVKSVKELIALAKARPGELNYASGGVGTSAHIGGELFKSLAGINIVHVPYKGGAQQVADMMSGQVQMAFDSLSGSAAHIKSGKLRVLAIGSADPSALAPGLPTIAATLPGFLLVGYTGMFAPAKTPDAAIKRLNQEVVRFLKSAEANERLLSLGSEPYGNSPEEATAAIKADMASLSKVIKDAGIKTE